MKSIKLRHFLVSVVLLMFLNCARGADRMATITSLGSNEVLSFFNDGELTSSVELGNGSIFGLNATELSIIDAYKEDNEIKRRLRVFDAHSGEKLDELPLETSYVSWLGQAAEQIIAIGDATYYFISVVDGGAEKGYAKTYYLSKADLKTKNVQSIPISNYIRSPRLLAIPGGIAIYCWSDGSVYTYAYETKKISTVIPSSSKAVVPDTNKKSPKYGMKVQSDGTLLRWNTLGDFVSFVAKDTSWEMKNNWKLPIEADWAVGADNGGKTLLLLGTRDLGKSTSIVLYSLDTKTEINRLIVPFDCIDITVAALKEGRAYLKSQQSTEIWSLDLSKLSLTMLRALPAGINPYPSRAQVIGLPNVSRK